MPLGLHPEAQRALVAALSEELAKIEVEHNSFLRTGSTVGLDRLDRILPGASSKTGQYIAAILGDEPISDFVFDQLSIQLARRPFNGDPTPSPLTTLDDFQSAHELAEQLVSQFESLPWSYSLFISMPYELGRRLAQGMTDREFELSDQYRLIRFDEQNEDYPSWSELRPSLLKIQTDKHFQPALVYLNGKLSGYVGHFLALRPIESFHLAIRSFFGLGMAERIVKPDYSHFLGERAAHVIVYRRESDSWATGVEHELDKATANQLHGLGPDKLIATLEDEGTRRWSSDFLERARAAFTDKIAGERILASGQWLFDSHSSKNELLAFVQAMVALEIVYGDKAATDLVGLGELLANRCAYAIAKTRQQREDVLSDFRRIYATRSKIVHRGHNRLSSRERADLSKLRWMVSRALQEEIKLSLAK